MALNMLLPRQSGGGGSQVGSNQNAGPNSASGLLWTVIPAVLIAGALLILLIVLQKRLKNLYLPRTYMGVFSQYQRTTWSGIAGFFKTKDITALHYHGLDAYLFLRFWRLALLICLFSWPITWIILMPVYGTANGGQTQFDKISFSNIDSSSDANRLYAVSIVSIIVLGGTLLLICRERLFAFKLILSFQHTRRQKSQLASRTVLLTDIQQGNVDHGMDTPGVLRVWPAASGKDLTDLNKDQTKSINKLEKALVTWAVQRSIKGSSDKPSSNSDPEDARSDSQFRPTSRFASMKKIGRKTDVISYQTEQFRTARSDIDSKRNESRAGEGSAQFIEFQHKSAAVEAFKYYDTKSKNRPHARAIGSAPEDIIWKNLEMSAKQRAARRAVVILGICLLILFWTPFTAFVGAISNINYLTNQVPFLSFINNVPSVFLGAITGFLPALILSLLIVLVPIVMRLLFKLAGCATLCEVELRTQRWHFVFQVIQVFLVTTLSSGAAAVATTIVQDPTQAVNILASNLPKASNFYISYLVLQGIAYSAKAVLNPGQIFGVILGKVTDKTPRQKVMRYTSIRTLQWGTLYPKFSLFIVIALSYSCIAPLVVGFAALGFALLYITFRYIVFYSAESTVINTHGQAYSKVLQQTTTGIYLAELCLIGLMAINTSNNTAGVGPLVLNILLLIVTIICHITFNATIMMCERRSADLLAQLDEQSSGKVDKPDSMAFSSALEKIFTDPTDGHSSRKDRVILKITSKLMGILRIPAVEPFPAAFSEEVEDMSSEEKRYAYVHPALQPAEPLWLPKDHTGRDPYSNLEVASVADIVTDGAWIEGKKVHVKWIEAQKEESKGQNVPPPPVWDDVRRY